MSGWLQMPTPRSPSTAWPRWLVSDQTGLTYIHTWRSYVHTACDFTNSASLAWRLHRRISTVMFTCGWAWPARSPIHIRFWASGGANFTKICDSLPWTPMNHRAKCDAASFILGREIRNCTNKQTNKQWTIYSHLANRHVWIIKMY